METRFYTVAKIDGDYALLTREGLEEPIQVARALLPEGIREGSQLKRELFQYELVTP